MEPLGWTGAVALVVAALVVADRLVARRPPRRREHRPRPGGALTGGPGLADLLGVFQPTVRHLHEEQERQRHDLVEAGDSDGPWGVDLDTGRATLRAPTDRPAPGV